MEENARMVFAERLRELRTKQRASQKEFAARIGISAATLSAYEKGTKSPVIATAVQIAIACDVSLDWLCGIPESTSKAVEQIPPEIDLLNLANFIFKFSSKGIILDNTDWNGRKVDEWALTFKRGSLNKFIESIVKLKELKDSAVLDGDMFKACVETAARKAIKEYNDCLDVPYSEDPEDDPEVPF